MSRTEKLSELKVAHRKRVAAIRADQDRTDAAKERRIKEETEKFDAARSIEEERIEASIRADVEAAYRSAHGPGPVLDAAAELRLARLREEVRDELDTKRLVPFADTRKLSVPVIRNVPRLSARLVPATSKVSAGCVLRSWSKRTCPSAMGRPEPGSRSLNVRGRTWKLASRYSATPEHEHGRDSAAHRPLDGREPPTVRDVRV